MQEEKIEGGEESEKEKWRDLGREDSSGVKDNWEVEKRRRERKTHCENPVVSITNKYDSLSCLHACSLNTWPWLDV